MYVIDHEMYGVRSEFASLAEAQAAIRACRDERRFCRFDTSGDDIYDERGQRIGEVKADD